jgi:hypothetical protein
MARAEEIVRTNAFILNFTATACLLGPPASAKDVAHHIQNVRSDFQITVYVAHSCHRPVTVGRVAENTVFQLFEQIGVSVRFIHAQPPPADTEAIALRILEHAPASLEAHVLGSAWVASQYPQADVFCDRLMQFYCGTSLRETGVLQGYAMAHELGHVLRADSGHSPAGIMRACWKQTDVVLMLQGVVKFCRADAERIHEVLEQKRERLPQAGEN